MFSLFFLCPSLSHSQKQELIDKFLQFLDNSGVAEILNEVRQRHSIQGGRPEINRYNLFATILYGFAFRNSTLREMEGGRFQIIAGERRWRASQLIGMKAIPAYIRTISDETVMELALVENIQREDLNAIEIALAYQHLLDTEGMTQDKVSERVGKSRAAISNHLRLLRLPAQIQLALQKKEIDMGHARALLSLDSPSMQIKVFKEILKHNFSVRQVEEFVTRLKNGEDVQSGTKTIKGKAQMPEKYLVIRDAISKAIGSRVTISCTSEGKGKITIPFTSEKQLKEIMKAIE